MGVGEGLCTLRQEPKAPRLTQSNSAMRGPVTLRTRSSLATGIPSSEGAIRQPSRPAMSQAANSSACRSAFAWFTHCQDWR